MMEIARQSINTSFAHFWLLWRMLMSILSRESLSKFGYNALWLPIMMSSAADGFDLHLCLGHSSESQVICTISFVGQILDTLTMSSNQLRLVFFPEYWLQAAGTALLKGETCIPAYCEATATTDTSNDTDLSTLAIRRKSTHALNSKTRVKTLVSMI